MKPEYRVIFTATFDDPDSRDAFYDNLKSTVAGVQTAAMSTVSGMKVADGDAQPTFSVKRADMTKDDYMIPDGNATEKVI